MADNADHVQELLARARDGDGAALGQLLDLFRSRLHGRAEGQLHRPIAVRADASDMVQITCMEAHKNFHQFQGADGDQFASWLNGILANTVAMTVRDNLSIQKRDVRRQTSADQSEADRPALRHELAAHHSTPSQRVSRSEDEERLLLALATLPADQANAVRLRHLDGWSLDAIAKHLDKSPTAAAGLVKRGLQALRKNMQGDAAPVDRTPNEPANP